mmetsp:Transcript_10092/g.20138  ORF Transcript_10092/g.20138 Transcript_10092/m.20138 type:complete len:110 (-) Transcript_10092:1-330(-)
MVVAYVLDLVGLPTHSADFEMHPRAMRRQMPSADDRAAAADRWQITVIGSTMAGLTIHCDHSRTNEPGDQIDQISRSRTLELPVEREREYRSSTSINGPAEGSAEQINK